MHKIYWFSGTGNTFRLANKFAESFPDVQLISIAALPRSEDIVIDSELTGFFFPVYCSGIPNIIAQFLDRIQPLKNQTGKYVYAVCTSGGIPGAALPMFEDTLQEKGINLNASFHIRMPSNYYPLSGAPSEKQQQALFAKADRAVRIAVIAVKKRRKTRPFRMFPIDTFIKFIARRAVATLADSDKEFETDSSCTGCGLCSNLCPASNITLDSSGHPVWHHHCEQCMACLQWCPAHAIRYKGISRKRARYHHPEVKAQDLLRIKDSDTLI